MRKKKITVVMSTFDRATFLERSLYMYGNQTMKDFEIIIVDDQSADNTFGVVKVFMKKLDIKYIYVKKPSGVEWRDGNENLNLGARAAIGDIIVLTHPEVIPGRESLEKVCDECLDDTYVACRPYYLTQEQQKMIHTVKWEDGIEAVRGLPNFYTAPSGVGGVDYSPQKIEEAETWESWVFGGMTKKTWRDIGGMAEYRSWGTVDLDFLARRQLLGIRNITLNDPETYCVHQNHDDLNAKQGNKKDINEAFANLKRYETPEEARLCNL